MVIMMLESDTLLPGLQRQHDPSLDNTVINAKCACVCVWGVGWAGNTGVHLDESDSVYEAVIALHATK